VSGHVIEDRRLDGVESTGRTPPVGQRHAQAPPHGLREAEPVPATASLQQSSVHEAGDHGRRRLRIPLHDGTHATEGEKGPFGRRAQHEQIVETQHRTRPLHFHHQSDPWEVRTAPAQDHRDVARRAATVLRSGKTAPEEVEKDRVDAARGALDDAGALEPVGQERVARVRRDDEQVVEPDALGKAARIRDLDPVFVPLDVDGPEAGVVTVDQRVRDGLAKCPEGVVGHPHPHHPHHQLRLLDPGAEARVDFPDDAQQRPAEEVVDPDFERAQHLEGGS
jgi:hypothetical protein